MGSKSISMLLFSAGSAEEWFLCRRVSSAQLPPIISLGVVLRLFVGSTKSGLENIDFGPDGFVVAEFRQPSPS